MKFTKFKKNPYKKIRQRIRVEHLNHLVETNRMSSFIAKCEENYFKQIKEAVNEIIKMKTKQIICVAGPTSSGKTTTAENIVKILQANNKNAMIISLDNFLVPLRKRELLPNGQVDYESFDTIDTELLQEFIGNLFENGYGMMPEYDFVEGKRKPDLTKVEYTKGTYLVIEGLHAFNPELLSNFEKKIYRIYICPYKDYYYKKDICLTAKELRLMRRCVRDCHKRGHSIDKTLELWQQITESEYLFIKPYRFSCNYFINSSIDYEICLYVKYLKPLLENVKNEQATWPLYAALDKLAAIDSKQIPDNTLLWEFLKKED